MLPVKEIENFIKTIYADTLIPLHRPVFAGNEKKYLSDCVDSNFVSSVGEKVGEFEKRVAAYTGAKYAVATVNGTAALHVALRLAGVGRDDEVITQALSFIATSNAISYLGAAPVFVDVNRETLGMSAAALKRFLEQNTENHAGKIINKKTGKRIAACVPMHTFGHPCEISQIASICKEYSVPLIEDAAEALGSFYHVKHAGTFGLFGVLSFNGNKIITTGSGGMILTNDESLAKHAKHITTTAKVPHPYEFVHDEVGYNYRLPNLNAALGCAQLEQLPFFLESKRKLAKAYQDFFSSKGMSFIVEPQGCSSNYWLNAICLKSAQERDLFLKETNQNGIMTRPIWRLMSKLKMFESCQHDGLENSIWLEERVVNIPSSVPWPNKEIL